MERTMTLAHEKSAHLHENGQRGLKAFQLSGVKVYHLVTQNRRDAYKGVNGKVCMTKEVATFKLLHSVYIQNVALESVRKSHQGDIIRFSFTNTNYFQLLHIMMIGTNSLICRDIHTSYGTYTHHIIGHTHIISQGHTHIIWDIHT